MDGAAMVIRAARADEAGALSALALRAKAHWGYDAAILAAYRDELTVTQGEIAAHTIRVATAGERSCGFYQLRVAGTTARLNDLWVEPGAIGRGIGRTLWKDAVATARSHGCREVLVQSDPHAEGFYRAMGAVRIGTQPSTILLGVDLPLLRLALAAD